MNTQDQTQLQQKQQFTSLEDILTIDGFKVSAKVEQDDTSQTPWEIEDGHGPVSEWTRREAREGERVLFQDHGCRSCFGGRYYDFDAAVEQAKKEGWDTKPYGQGTPEERAVRAAEADFKRLKDWCHDLWCYVGIIVTVSKAGIELGSSSLWGIESDCDEYGLEVANDLIDEAINEAKKKLKELCE